MHSGLKSSCPDKIKDFLLELTNLAGLITLNKVKGVVLG